MRSEPNPPLGNELLELLEQWPQGPYGYCPGVSREAQAEYVLASLRRAQQQGAPTFLAKVDGRPEAVLQLECLPWDSQILGFPVARITAWIARESAPGSDRAREELLHRALEELPGQGFRYLLGRLPAADIEGIHLLERNGFQLVDGLLTFGTSVAASQPAGPAVDGLRCQPFQPGDLQALREIAAQSFSIDRFHADPAIGVDKATRAYQQWIEDSCAGFAAHVLVAHDGDVAGFTTLQLDSLAKRALGVGVGIVVLVATATRHRRRGVARLLTCAALDWFQQAGCAWVEVGTQLANIPASRVYQAAGFRLVGSSLTFRRLW